jgi:hypothetical protein
MKIINHISAIAIITIMFLMIYAGVQQAYRSGANDPQQQLLEDLGERIRQGRNLGSLLDDTVQLDKSLAVFVETFDSSGKPVRSSGFLDGNMPELPRGVLEHARARGEHWVTWQPRDGVRMAMGITHVNAPGVSYIAIGRSLREVEKREQNLGQMIFISWVICVVIVGLNGVFIYHSGKKQTTKTFIHG